MSKAFLLFISIDYTEKYTACIRILPPSGHGKSVNICLQYFPRPVSFSEIEGPSANPSHTFFAVISDIALPKASSQDCLR